MKTFNFHKLALFLAGLCLAGFAWLVASGHIAQAGPFLVGFFVMLALGFRGYELLKGFAYSVMIFAAVTIALYFPQYLVELNGFRLAGLITPLIQLIMFGMGTSMSVKDFVAVAKTPRAVAIGVGLQFTIMPSLGYGLASISGLEPEIAAGIVLIG